MLSLRRMSVIIFSVYLSTVSFIYSEEAVCHRCEEIRQYNAEHHQNFEYYDEFLKIQDERSQEPSNDRAKNKEANVPLIQFL